jgi:hypothetical protein
MPEYKEIYNALEVIKEKIDGNNESLQRIEKEISILNHHVFQGNGKPSVLARLASLESYVESEAKQGESHSKLKIFGVVAGIILIGVASVADVVLKTGIAQTIKELVIAII